jgi:hypothetical protein
VRLSLYCRPLASRETVPLLPAACFLCNCPFSADSLFLVRLSLYCRQLVSHETVHLLFLVRLSLYCRAALARETVPLFAQVGKEFGTVMKKVFEHLETLDFDEKTINSIGRVVHIWEERGIFDKRIQAKRGLKTKCLYFYEIFSCPHMGGTRHFRQAHPGKTRVKTEKSALSSLFRLCFCFRVFASLPIFLNPNGTVFC